MKAKRILALGIGAMAAIAGAAFAAAVGTQAQTTPASPLAHLTVGNTEIVLPTTMYVNGTPLNVKQDTISASWLALDLYKKSIHSAAQMEIAVKYVDHYSEPFSGNGTVYLTKDLMPDLPYKTTTNLSEVVNDTIAIMANLSAIKANLTADTPYVELGDKAVQIVFDLNNSPVIPDFDKYYSVMVTNSSGDHILYLYSHNDTITNVNLGGTYYVGGWKFDVTDIDVNGQRVLIELYDPSGENDLLVLNKGSPLVAWYTPEKGYQYETFDNWTAAEAFAQNLTKEGTQAIVMFEVTDTFIGVDGTKKAFISSEYYKLEKTYHDGQVYKGQWVLSLANPDDEHITLYLKVNPDHGFPAIKLTPGEDLALPLSKEIDLRPIFIKDENGTVTGVQFEWVWKEKVTFTYKCEKWDIPAITPQEIVIPDTALTTLPDDKNIIIVGGWVSNKAWQVLKESLSSTTYEKLVNDVKDMNDSTPGYALEVIPNPKNPDYYIVVVAGVDYKHTREAVLQLMQELDKS